MKVLNSIMVAAAAVVSAQTMAAEKPAIALVHGAFEDVHIWDGVSAKLQADGYRVISVDLPGRPSAPMASNLVSLDVYRDAVLKAIAGERQPVVLVGHSFGGIPCRPWPRRRRPGSGRWSIWPPTCRRM